MKENGAIVVSIVIPTRRRPEGLRKAVLSCLRQEDLERPVELVVIDNDSEGTAAPIVAELVRNARTPIRYLREDRPGISFARNTGVAAARGCYVAFLDDDEVAAPRWLASLLATIERARADIAIGPVYPEFSAPDSAVPPYAKKMYTRDARLQSGAELTWGGIGNCLIDAARCFTSESPFDPRLGLTGGEDAVFLHQARIEGRKLVWCAEAIAWESLAPDKLTPSYLLRRSFRGGQTTTFKHVEAKPMEPWRALRWMAIGCAQVLAYAPLGALLFLARQSSWLETSAKAASGLGKAFWHPALQPQLYRNVPKAPLDNR